MAQKPKLAPNQKQYDPSDPAQFAALLQATIGAAAPPPPPAPAPTTVNINLNGITRSINTDAAGADALQELLLQLASGKSVY